MAETVGIGESGVEISRIGLGGFELGPGEGETPDVSTGRAVVDAAIAAGVNWIDTAEAYHRRENERVIGEVLAGRDLLVSSKVAPVPDGSGFRRDEVHAACRASLERLRRDAIDVYFLHWPDESGVPLEETWGAMSELRDDGFVRAIGLSNFGVAEVERCHAQHRVDVVQDGLSLVDHLDNRDLFARCRELSIAAVVYEPLGSGALTGRPIAAIREAWAGYEEWGFYKRLLDGDNGARTEALVEALRALAADVGLTVPQLAIAWVLEQAGVTAAIAGSRNPTHVEENARAADVDLGEIRAEIEKLIEARG
jgi:aryl-alcohol dehydrogenase-like predicted oxidoreductase